MQRTEINHQLLHACRTKRYALTAEQMARKALLKLPHGPGAPIEQMLAQETARNITALHIIEAELRGLAPANKEPSWSVLYHYRSAAEEGRKRFAEWVATA